jgi:hypothetical protein
MVDDLMMNLDEQWREGADVHEDTLDVYLIECLEQYFGVDFEDGADAMVTEVSLLLQDLYRKCASGDLAQARALVASLDTLPSMNARAGASRTDQGSEEEDSGSEEGEEEFHR